MTLPVQEFRIGQCVRDKGGASFTIQSMYLSNNGRIKYSGALGRGFYVADELTLASDRQPYVPSERRIVLHSGECPTFAFTEIVSAPYRCETDDELAVRHAVERAEYDRLGADDGGTP